MSSRNYEEYTIEDFQKEMEQGDLTSRGLAEYYLDRIEKYDRSGPALNSVLQLNPDALEIADGLDKERGEKGPRSPLHGIPLLIKANIDSADKMETTAGSAAMNGHVAEKDAFTLARLREAGALILGKTNLSEWANFRSERSSSGWSSLGGQTLNPYDRDRSPCGSSSGSGVAASANLCAAAVGTETDGSVICPSHMNGIVGIKPTLGLVSRSGIIPIAHSQDTAGPMARTVSDAVHLLDGMTGHDPDDAITEQFSFKGEKRYAEYLRDGSLKSARIGIPRNLYGFRLEVDILMGEAIKLMKEAGAIVVDDLKLPHKGDYDDAEYEVLLYEFKEDLNKYLEQAGGKVKNLKELIEFNKENKETMMPWFAQEILIKAQAKGPLSEEKYKEALAKCRKLSREEGIDKLIEDNSLDAIIAPSGGPSWKIDLINGDHYTGGGASQCAAVSGYPHITVPAGLVKGLPAGLSFIGPAYSEPKLIALAYSYEQLSRKRRAPKLE